MSVISGVVGATTQKSSAKAAANAQKYAADAASQVQWDMFEKMLEVNEPFWKVGVETALPKLESDLKSELTDTEFGTTKQTQRYLSELENLPDFSYSFNADDPAYQFKLSEAQKAIDAASASRGNYNSRAAINTLSEAQRAITADEVTQQYSRAKDQYDMQYGKLTDLYNMANQIGLTDYNKLIDLVKIGQGTAASAGTGALATGQGVASTYAQLGQGLSNAELASGQASANLWGGIGATNTNAAMLYSLYGNKAAGTKAATTWGAQDEAMLDYLWA